MFINLPNQITLARLLLAVIFFVLLAVFDWNRREEQAWMLDAALGLFVVAAVSDILDGYLARKHNQVTSFGRVLDPFVDKILVCGAFVMLLGRGYYDSTGKLVTGLEAWMVVVVLARELLVTGLRGFSEAAGKPYAANTWGKAKMLIQSVTVPVILFTMGRGHGMEWLLTARTIVVWLMVGVTILSGLSYLSASREALAEKARG